jgi:hypothetical protein
MSLLHTDALNTCRQYDSSLDCYTVRIFGSLRSSTTQIEHTAERLCNAYFHYLCSTRLTVVGIVSFYFVIRDGTRKRMFRVERV